MTTSAPAPSSTPVFRRILIAGSLLALAVGIVAAPVGFAVSGGPGLVGGVLGAAFALVFLGATAASILVANRFAGSPLYTTLFFGVVMGTWILKLVIFLVLAVVLRNQPWLDGKVLFVTLVAAVIGSLVLDVVVITRSRMPLVSDLAADRRID